MSGARPRSYTSYQGSKGCGHPSYQQSGCFAANGSASGHPAGAGHFGTAYWSARSGLVGSAGNGAAAATSASTGAETRVGGWTFSSPTAGITLASDGLALGCRQPWFSTPRVARQIRVKARRRRKSPRRGTRQRCPRSAASPYVTPPWPSATPRSLNGKTQSSGGVPAPPPGVFMPSPRRIQPEVRRNSAVPWPQLRPHRQILSRP